VLEKNSIIPQPGILPKKPKLSVCMIVRDEEKMLPRCLKSVQGVADELIVVDTGSKDNTISIATDFGAKIFHFKWNDDFAEARNESLKHATGDWILQIDADEDLPSGSIPHIKKHMLKSRVLCYFIRCDNGPECRGPRFDWFIRLFRNHPWFHYERPYHESIEPSVDKIISRDPLWKVQYEPTVIIRHFGYEPFKMPGKWERGLRIMRSYIEENPNDTYILTKLGGVCYNLGRYDEAKAYLNKALKIDPDWAETNYNLGLVLQKQKKVEAAIRCYEKAIASNPNATEAYNNLGIIYIQKGMLDNAIVKLKRALDVDPNDGEIHFLLAFTYCTKKLYGLAKQHCDKAEKLGCQVPQWFLQELKGRR